MKSTQDMRPTQEIAFGVQTARTAKDRLWCWGMGHAKERAPGMRS